MHTLVGHRKDNRSQQKVHTLGSPVLFAKSMHTRQPRLYDILRKSAYTRQTPKEERQPAKSAYTRLPAFCFILYAYYPDTIRQKVHTLGGHLPAVLRAKSMHTRLPPKPFKPQPAKSVHPSQPSGWQTPPSHSGRLNPAERLSRGFWPASPLFLLFLCLSFGFVGREAAVCPRFGAYFTRGSSESCLF